jgi:ribosome-binding factor A
MFKDSIGFTKKDRRMSFFLREISSFIQKISMDEPKLLSVYPTRVKFSDGEGMCYVYFSSHNGEEGFLEALEVLKLYKPSMRKALAKMRSARYTPDLYFRYDKELDEVRHMENVLDEIKKEDIGDDEHIADEADKKVKN